MQNKKISTLQNNDAGDSFLNEDSLIAVYNPVTKELRYMSIGDLQQSFGLESYKFYVGENGGVVPSEKFAVFGDAKIMGVLRVDSAGIGTTDLGRGFEIGADLFVNKITSNLDNGVFVEMGDTFIDFQVDNLQALRVETDKVVINNTPANNIKFVVKTSDSTAIGDTALIVDPSSLRVGVGTDIPRGTIDVNGDRVIFGSGSLNADASKGGFSALGGVATGNFAAAFNYSTASGDSSFSVNTGQATGLKSFASGSSIAAGENSAAHGNLGQALAPHSHVEGNENTVEATGTGSHAEGDNNTVESEYSHVGGKSNTIFLGANFASCHGEGNSVQALASFSTTFGENNTHNCESGFLGGKDSQSTGNYNIVHGRNLEADGDGIALFGEDNRGLKNYSFSSGFNNLADGVGAFSSGNGCQSLDDRAFTFGIGCIAKESDSRAEGIEAVAEQTGEHALAAGKTLGATKSQRSQYFLMREIPLLTTLVKYPLRVANGTENIKIKENGVYQFEATIVGRGRLTTSARVAGETLNWAYKIRGNFSIYDDNGTIELSNDTAPFLTCSKNSSIYGIDPSNFKSETQTVATPEEYCELEGVSPYIEFDSVNKELIIGIVKPDNRSYFDVGALYAGNVDGNAEYYLFPSVVFKGKNAAVENLSYDDIQAFFNKDFNYFDTNYPNEEFNRDYIIKDENGVEYPNGININYEGTGTSGESVLSNITDTALTGFSGFCFGTINDSFETNWHATVDVNILTADIAYAGAPEIDIRC